MCYRFVGWTGRSDSWCRCRCSSRWNRSKKIDSGFSNEYLAMLKNKMEPGNSGIVTLVETERVQELITAMKSVGGQIYQQKINDDIISELAPHD